MSKDLPTLKDIKLAQEKLATHLICTPVSKSLYYSKKFGQDIYFKWDNKFHTGCFKERGALNFLLHLNKTQKKVIAASAGNHAQSVAYHSQKLGLKATIVMPETAPLVKMKATESYNAKIILNGKIFDDAKVHARNLAKDLGATIVHAFDNYHVVSGQGVSALEALEQVKNLDTLIVPVGGGGYISGISIAAKSLNPKIKIIGVRTEWTSINTYRHKENILDSTSIADGIAVKRIGKLNEKIIKNYVDDIIYVSESEIAKALIELLRNEHILVEGACAAGLAFMNSSKTKKLGKTLLFMGGSNIDLNLLARLIERDEARKGKVFKFSISVPDKSGSLEAITNIIASTKANILSIYHDRHYSKTPGNVEIEVVLEVRDADHTKEVVKAFKDVRIELQRSVDK